MSELGVTVGKVMVLIGSLLTLLAAIGMVRFTDVFARMHSLAKASTAGVLLVLIGRRVRAVPSERRDLAAARRRAAGAHLARRLQHGQPGHLPLRTDRPRHPHRRRAEHGPRPSRRRRGLTAHPPPTAEAPTPTR